MLTDYIRDEEEDVVRVDQLRDHCGGGHRKAPSHGRPKSVVSYQVPNPSRRMPIYIDS